MKIQQFTPLYTTLPGLFILQVKVDGDSRLNYVEDSFLVLKYVKLLLTHVVYVLVGSDEGQEMRLFISQHVHLGYLSDFKIIINVQIVISWVLALQATKSTAIQTVVECTMEAEEVDMVEHF